MKDVRTRRKRRTRNIEMSKYFHLLSSFNYLKNIVNNKKKLYIKIVFFLLAFLMMGQRKKQVISCR